MNARNPFIEINLPAGSLSQSPAAASARLPQFVGGPQDAAKRLSSLRALVVGVGSIGFEFIQQLVRWHVAVIGIIDPKKFKPESILTHGAPPEAIGEAKAGYAARLAKRISPRSRVFAFEGEFASLPLSWIARYDVVFLATDNLLAELQVSQACYALGVPVVQGSVHGETLSGHVRFYGHGSPSAPCAGCGFTSEEWAHLNRSTVFSCEGLQSPASKLHVGEQPTMSVHALCSLIAQLALLHFSRDYLGLGAPVRDTVLEYCAYTQQIVTTKLARRSLCPCPHIIFRRATPPRPLSECSLRELAHAAGSGEQSHCVSFEVDDLHYVERAACSCGEQQPVHRFVAADADGVGRCHKCQQTLSRNPFHSFQRVPETALAHSGNLPLRELGAADARWVVVRYDAEAVLFLNHSELSSALPA